MAQRTKTRVGIRTYAKILVLAGEPEKMRWSQIRNPGIKKIIHGLQNSCEELWNVKFFAKNFVKTKLLAKNFVEELWHFKILCKEFCHNRIICKEFCSSLKAHLRLMQNSKLIRRWGFTIEEIIKHRILWKGFCHNKILCKEFVAYSISKIWSFLFRIPCSVYYLLHVSYGPILATPDGAIGKMRYFKSLVL